MQGHLHKQGKYWYLKIDIGKTPDGKRQRKNINTKCEKKSDAKVFQAHMISQLNKGDMLNAKSTEFLESTINSIGIEDFPSNLSKLNNDVVLKEEVISFPEYMSDWLNTYVKINCEMTTYDGYKVIVDKHITPYFKDISLKELKPIDIQNYYDYLITDGRSDGKGGLSPTTIKAHHNVIRKALSRAVMPLQLIDFNPSLNVELPKRTKYKSNVYTIEQIKILLNTSKDEPINIAIWLASGLGLRRGEVIGLRWDDVDLQATDDFENGFIRIRNTRVQTEEGVIEKGTKTQKSNRILPLPRYLKEYLQGLKRKQMKNRLLCGNGYKGGNYICVWDDGTPVKPDYVSRRFRRILEKNNLPPIRFHDLRHTNATLLLEQNVNMKWLSDWLGHSTISTTMDIYAHVTDNIKKEVANKLDDVFSG